MAVGKQPDSKSGVNLTFQILKYYYDFSLLRKRISVPKQAISKPLQKKLFCALFAYVHKLQKIRILQICLKSKKVLSPSSPVEKRKSGFGIRYTKGGEYLPNNSVLHT